MSKRPSSSLVDTEMTKRGVWIVKVPRYLSEIWEANEGADVGKIVIPPANSRSQDLRLLTKAGIAKPTNPQHAVAGPHKIPQEHAFIMHSVQAQTMAVLGEDKAGLDEDASIKSGRLTIEGRVVKLAECRPSADSNYLKMKAAHILNRTKPEREVKQLEKAAVKFKPVSVHEEEVARIKQKKEGAKTVRADKDVVMSMLFHAFEKHQYYRLQDLQQVTQQPAGYVKELLQEIAVYNAAPPHKSMWELKPEYRSYAVQPSSPQ